MSTICLQFDNSKWLYNSVSEMPNDKICNTVLKIAAGILAVLAIIPALIVDLACSAYYHFCGVEKNGEEQLESMFASSVEMRKIFTIEGSKVAIVFNPHRAEIMIGCAGISKHIALVSDKTIPDSVAQRIIAKIPSHFTYSILCLGKVDGLTPFQELGLE